MDDFVPTKVFSSIDHHGRYGYNNQPNLAAWNMAQLATALLPLANDTDAAIEKYTKIVQGFSGLFEVEYAKVFSKKIGLKPSFESAKLIKKLLGMMDQTGADFTQSFRALGSDEILRHIGEHPDFGSWHDNWSQTANLENLNQVNPAMIARNHLVESMITQSVAGDIQPFHDLNAALKSPFITPQNPEFIAVPNANAVVHQTFCGT